MAKYTMQNSSNVSDVIDLVACGDHSKLHPTTFELSKLGYSNSSPDKLVSANPPNGYSATNGGFWGVLLDTPYYYSSSSVQATPTKVPFVDKQSCPMPCLFTGAFAFPTATGVGNSNWPYMSLNYYKELPASSYTLTISYSAGKLQVKQGSTSLLNTAASSYILMEIQAPGGNGGSGAYAQYDGWINSNDKMGVAGGGGGGSGSFLYLSANLSAGSITLTVSSSQIKVKSSASSDYIIMTKGGNGGNGSASDTPSASGGTAGSAGTIKLYNSSGTVLDEDTAICESVVGSFCVIESCNGVAGAKGASKTVSGNTALNSGNTVSGNTAGKPNAAYGISLSTHPGCDFVEHLSTISGGTGESASATTANAMAGGGGGAASSVTSGASHGETAGTGAGGYGESGWTGMSSNGGGAGGAGGLWIQYNPS